MNRRGFVKTGALLGSGLLISFTVFQVKRLGAFGNESKEDFTPNAFLKVGPDGRITVFLSHVEMGQGIWTTLPMLIAEELDVDLDQITVKHGGANKAYNHIDMHVQITGGSTSTSSEFDRYRQAGAAARLLLIEAAAIRAGVAIDQCTTQHGMVMAGNQRFRYGEIASDAAKLPPPKEIPLRPTSNWRLIGKGAKRLDTKVKSNGQATFGMDVQFDGLLTAVVAHAPTLGGKVTSFQASEAMTVPGVRKVVQIPTGIAVIADHFWAAQQGRKALKISWDEGSGEKMNTVEQTKSYRKIAATDGKLVQKKGHVDQALAKSPKVVSAEYVLPYVAHAPMEPLNCTVKIHDDHCEIWTGTQLPAIDRDNAAKALGFSPEQVIINVPFLGGGFGRRATPTSDFVLEAVYIAKISGLPIKMVWTREDDIKAGYYRPFYVHKVQVGLDSQGMPMAWKHNLVGQAILKEVNLFYDPSLPDNTQVEGLKDSPYLDKIPDHFVGVHTSVEPVRVLWLRSVGNTHTAYVIESMIDELAYSAKIDPVDYRRLLLKGHSRHLAALNLSVEKSAYRKPLPRGQFRGVAVHEAMKSFVAIVAVITIVNGHLKVLTIDCAIDCGLAVNPDGVKAQMESCVIFGLTKALYGSITIENGRIQQSNFYDYQLARMDETPIINVHIVDSNEPMGGAGESGVPPVAPAICNAIFAATGQRIYELPIKNHTLTERL